MDRRTFLKGVFAVAVTPASAVLEVYRPRGGVSEKDLRELITATLQDMDFDEPIRWKNYYNSYQAVGQIHKGDAVYYADKLKTQVQSFQSK